MTARLAVSLRRRIRQRPDLWPQVCVLSLELLEGTDKHVDAVLALYRNPASTREQFHAAANAAYAANAAAAAAAANAAYAANAAAAAVDAANAAAAYAAAAVYAAANAANAAAAAVDADAAKRDRFIAQLELLVRFAPTEVSSPSVTA